MDIQMRRREAGDHDGVAGDPGQGVCREHSTRHLDDRVRAAPLDQPKEPCREDVRPAQVGHHGLGGIGVEAA